MTRTNGRYRGAAAVALIHPWRQSAPLGAGRPVSSRVAGAIGFLALCVAAAQWAAIENASIAQLSDLGRSQSDAPGSGAGGRGEVDAWLDQRVMVGGYGGVTHTYPSVVTIKNPGQTDLTVKGFEWLGKPFKSPIYYGLRGISWPQGSRFGGMIDFTHAKAIANPDDIATFNGTLDGKPLPAKSRIGDTFKHLEFSHGHNMVTLNGLMRLGGMLPRISPYVGIGGGVSLPHTEVAFRGENGRTYEYQYAGVVGQGLAGIEVRLGRASVFVEYKFSYAPYDVPLSGVVNGWLLVTDVWRQITAWTAGSRPPRGRLSTRLMTHHGIAGVLVRASGSGR
jgi:lipid A oxidase